jgi:hypothetical protein
MEYGGTLPNEAVELVLLCRKYASKWMFYSCFMALNEVKFFEKDLFDSLNRSVRNVRQNFCKHIDKIN